MALDFEVTGLKETISKFQHDYKDKINTYKAKVHKEVADTMEYQASTGFRNVLYSTNDDSITVTSETRANKNGTTVTDIHATGKTVYFVEFGTGSYFPDDNPMKDTYNAVRGSYGKHQGLKHHWVYYDDTLKGVGTVPETYVFGWRGNKTLVYTRGLPAHRCMYEALQDGIELAEKMNGGFRL